jgi:hypothetical protein
LLKGKQYMAVNITKDPPILFRFRVIEGPYRTSGKYGWAMKVAEMPDARVAMKKNYNVRELSLGDYSVFPDEEGKWSKHNYFTFLIGEGGTEDYSGIYTHLVCKCDDVSAGSYRYHCSCSCKCPPWISEKDWSILQGHSPTK